MLCAKMEFSTVHILLQTRLGMDRALQYFSTDIDNNFQILDEDLIESKNTYYYYPVVHPDGGGNMILVFNKSSINNYVGIAYTKHIKNSFLMNRSIG